MFIYISLICSYYMRTLQKTFHTGLTEDYPEDMISWAPDDNATEEATRQQEDLDLALYLDAFDINLL